MATILLSLAGLLLALIAGLVLYPRLRGTTVTRTVSITRPVAETRVVTRTVKVNGRDVEAEVPETVHRAVAELSTQSVNVVPTGKEKIWIYGMLMTGGFLGLFSVATAAAWFYFLIKKDGEVPGVVNEMLKSLITAFMGVFVGFMGGASIAEGKQASPSGPGPAASEPVSSRAPTPGSGAGTKQTTSWPAVKSAPLPSPVDPWTRSALPTPTGTPAPNKL